jgi:hypothetical protein
LEQGVRIGITYTPGVRPGMLVLGGARSTRLDSARTILARDLNHSDAFEMITLPMGDDLVLSIDTPESDTAEGAEDNGAGSFVNFALYAALGADYAVNVRSTVDSVIADSILPDSAVLRSSSPYLTSGGRWANSNCGFRWALRRRQTFAWSSIGRLTSWFVP